MSIVLYIDLVNLRKVYISMDNSRNKKLLTALRNLCPEKNGTTITISTVIGGKESNSVTLTKEDRKRMDEKLKKLK